MFYIYTIRDSVAVPPSKLGGELKEAVLSQLREDLEGRVDEDMGILVAVTSVKEVGDAVIIPGDPNVYVDATFDVLTYVPLLQEVADGFVTDVAEFGLFVRVGPVPYFNYNLLVFIYCLFTFRIFCLYCTDNKCRIFI
jgi:DNA-directed RNA polymerase subunit E'